MDDKKFYSAVIGLFRAADERFSYDRVCLLDVEEIGGDSIRDHMWVRLRDKDIERFRNLGASVKFSAELSYYLDPATLKKDKVKLKRIRDISCA